MDCCNYMPYRPSDQPLMRQGVYGAPYFDGSSMGMPHQYRQNYQSVTMNSPEAYRQHSEFYHDYYNCYNYSGPFYMSPTHPLPDYVYNPKEARIRKAMREASRERSIGASPVISRTEQRPQVAGPEWGHASQQQMMMPPMMGMRSPSGSCGYPMSNHQNHFMHPPLNNYNKMDTSTMPQNASLIDYIQPSPLAQLQHQTEMWYNYQENMRPRAIGNSFMMPEIGAYEPHQSESNLQEAPTNLVMRPHSSPCCPMTPAPNNSPAIEEHARPDVPETPHNYPAAPRTEIPFETGSPKESKKSPAKRDDENEENPAAGAIKKEESNGLKEEQEELRSTKCGKHVFLPLSRTNFCASQGLQSNDEIFQREYISKYFENHSDYNLWEIKTQDGLCFPLATSSPPASEPDHFLDIINFERGPNWIYTDVGYIPVVENDIAGGNASELLDLSCLNSHKKAF